MTIIEEFAIEPKLGVFVADNAANCDSACRALVKQFRPYESENSRRSRCLGHILHLAARKLIYGGDSEAFVIKAEQIEQETFRDERQTTSEQAMWRSRGAFG